jgi:hypothetical protein
MKKDTMKENEQDEELDDVEDGDESLDSPEDEFFEFVGQLDFKRPNISVELTVAELAQWDADDDAMRDDFREAVALELLDAADSQKAGYALLFDDARRILMVARFDQLEKDWLYLITEADFRPKENEIFQV